MKQTPQMAAIGETAKEYPECPALEFLLRRWYESEEFYRLLEELKKPDSTLANRDVINSFIEVSGFDAGDETEAQAQQILSTFKRNLLNALLATEGGLRYLLNQEQALHQKTHNKLDELDGSIKRLAEETREAISKQIKAANQVVAGVLEILPVNERGHNKFTMSYPDRELYLYLDFHIKSNVPAEVLSLELIYGQGNLGLDQTLNVDGVDVGFDNYKFLSRPIGLEPGATIRVRMMRMFSPSWSINFDDLDRERFDEIRESLDYDDVTIIADINFKTAPGVVRKSFRFHLRPGGELIPFELATDNGENQAIQS